MSFFFTAKFIKYTLNNNSYIIRHNTRLWFNNPGTPIPSGICVGAVVGLNPGSAIGEIQQKEIIGNCDTTMARVLRTFEIAYKLRNKKIPELAYIQMLNLFYLREANSSAALNQRNQNESKFLDLLDPSEHQNFPFLWLAWGSSATNEDMKRFLYERQERCCWIGSDQKFHFDKPLNAWLVRHPLCRTQGFTIQRNAEMIAQMLD